MLETFLGSFTKLMDGQVMTYMLIGVIIGMIVGILPGLGSTVTMALMLPFIYSMTPFQAFAFLLGMYVVTVSISPMLLDADRSSRAGPLLSIVVIAARTSGSTAVPDSLRSSSARESSKTLRAAGPSAPEEYASSALSSEPV